MSLELNYHIHTTDSPFWSFAIHDGHQVSSLLEPYYNIDAATRLREEDPYTAVIAELPVNQLVVGTSRFELDLNRAESESIYLQPDQAWGLQVWRETLPETFLDILYRQHQALYRTVDSHLERSIQDFGYFIALDIHSYNCKREHPDCAINTATDPQINIGTEYISPKWRQLTDHLVDFMRSQTLYNEEIDVRENIKFKGGNFGRHLNHRFGDTGCVWSIEFRKDFMDEWTGEPYIHRIAACKQLLINTLEHLKNYLPDAKP